MEFNNSNEIEILGHLLGSLIWFLISITLIYWLWNGNLGSIFNLPKLSLLQIAGLKILLYLMIG